MTEKTQTHTNTLYSFMNCDEYSIEKKKSILCTLVISWYFFAADFNSLGESFYVALCTWGENLEWKQAIRNPNIQCNQSFLGNRSKLLLSDACCQWRLFTDLELIICPRISLVWVLYTLCTIWISIWKKKAFSFYVRFFPSEFSYKSRFFKCDIWTTFLLYKKIK